MKVRKANSMKRNSLVIEEESLVDSSQQGYIHVNKFNEESAKSFYIEFNKLESNNNIKIITIVIDSYGGEVHSLLAMADVIDASSKPVATIALGKAMSCGSFLLVMGTPGLRYSAPNADIMIHEVSSVEFGKATDIDNGAKVTRQLNDRLFKMMAKKCGQKQNFFLEQLKKSGNVDWYLNASKARKLGLVDHIGLPKLMRRALRQG